MKKKHIILIVCFGILTFAIIAGAIFAYYGGFGTGDCADTEAFAESATDLECIEVPKGTKIVALGEATHGNSEFQQLKLDVFKQMVEKEGVRAFALEGDYGGCETVNRYIHGGEGTAADAAAAIGFAIYRTDEMETLIDWMRTYNTTAASGDDLRFYGFDMQRYENNMEYLIEAVQNLGIDAMPLEKLWDGREWLEEYDSDDRAAVIGSVKDAMLGFDTEQNATAVHLADILLQNITMSKELAQCKNGVSLRDRLMAENVMWILAREKARGKDCIFISAHNGHVEQNGSYDGDSKVMGAILADKVGINAYFVMGTDFYKTCCNLPSRNDGKRGNHTFYSHDPLAKAAKKCGYNRCWIDFSKISEDSPLKAHTAEYIWMGSLGEGYNAFYMNVLPMSYRVWRCPEDCYDGLIIVPEPRPVTIYPETPER